MTDIVTPQGPFMNDAVINLAFLRTLPTIERRAIEMNRPNGALILLNPFVPPEPKLWLPDGDGSFIGAFERFRDTAVLWAAAIGDPDDKFLTTALSKAWISHLLAGDSGNVPAWALPFNVTRYDGGVARSAGVLRLVSAYSGASAADDKVIATEFLGHIEDISGSLRADLLRNYPEINFLDGGVADLIRYPIITEEAGQKIVDITDRVKAVEVTLEAIAA